MWLSSRRRDGVGAGDASEGAEQGRGDALVLVGVFDHDGDFGRRNGRVGAHAFRESDDRLAGACTSSSTRAGPRVPVGVIGPSGTEVPLSNNPVRR